MQEEVENKTLTLIVSGTKFTGRLLKAAITKYMAHRKEVKVEKPISTFRTRRSGNLSGLRESTAWIMRSRRTGAHRRPST